MRDGFIKVATMTPEVKVADVRFNVQKIIEGIEKAAVEEVSLLVFPELCVTGYTCGDLFAYRTLIEAAEEGILDIANATIGKNMLVFVGAPLRASDAALYDCAIAIYEGDILGVTPKKHPANYGANDEARHFSVPTEDCSSIMIGPDRVEFGTHLRYQSENMPAFTVSAEIGEDLWVSAPPSLTDAEAGVTVIVNLSADPELVGRLEKRRAMVTSQSARICGAYLYANAGSGESTTDGVWSGHSLIAENGHLLAENKPFSEGMASAIIDVFALADDRAKKNTFKKNAMTTTAGDLLYFDMREKETETPKVPKSPFIPEDESVFAERAETILNIQSYALKKRLAHAHCKTAVIGISGGLDSTLALLVAVRAMDLLGRDRKDIIAVTMPCFGTTVRTKSNAVMLAEALGTTVRTVDIKRAVGVHFEDIGHDGETPDVTFENAQARERTQVIMDIANMENGIVVGTGDLSEVALGWSTYNGDHMSMYGVNAGIPKTLMRKLVAYVAETMDGDAKKALLDIVDTPVSPELLPAKDGEIAQKTEEIVGPYDLHDFFLYYIIRKGYSPKKVFRIAMKAFEDEFDAATIHKWLRSFYRRFFMQQFKRSCSPDAPKIGSVALSARGDLRIPSDAVADIWLNEVDEIKF